MPDQPKCRRCPALLLFARHYESGKTMPLNAVGCSSNTPVCWAVVGGIAYPKDVAVHNRSLTRGISTARALEELEDLDVFHVSHFADCPAANTFRKPRGPRGHTPTLEF